MPMLETILSDLHCRWPAENFWVRSKFSPDINQFCNLTATIRNRAVAFNRKSSRGPYGT